MTTRSNIPDCRDSFRNAGYTFLNKATCEACGAAIEWWLTTRKKKLSILAAKTEDVFALVTVHYPNRCPGIVVDHANPELVKMAFAMADTLAESTLDAALLTVRMPAAPLDEEHAVEYYDLDSITHLEKDHVDEALNYLGLRGRLITCPINTNLVRIGATR